jgi:hypothetical protein
MWLLLLASAISVSAAESIVYNNNTIQYNSLDETIRQRPNLNALERDRQYFLMNQPDLILDNSILVIDPSAYSQIQALSVRNLILRNGSKIITNGFNLEVAADQILSDQSSVFIAFDPISRGAAQEGTNGGSGVSAGTLVLQARVDSNGVLQIILNGQDGQAGGTGVSGPQGVAGRNGDNAADHIFDCAHGGGDGGNGAQGGPGGEGGRGGAGGDGGRLILKGALAGQREQIRFQANGGKGGAGGIGGPGGPGGLPGRGGHGSHYCGGGRDGNSGLPGFSGPNGRDGPNGRPGFITSTE